MRRMMFSGRPYAARPLRELTHHGVQVGLLNVLVILLVAPAAFAQSQPEPLSILKGRPDQPATGPVLGPMYKDRLQGISLRPPIDSQTIRQGLVTGDIVEFVNEKLSWSLKVSRADLPQSIPLASASDKKGILDLTADQFKAANPAAKILEQKIEPIGSYQVGRLVADYHQSDQTRLMQQAIFQFNNRTYYVLTMTSPAGDSAAERRATETFDAVAGTVELFDRSTIKKDQDARLLRARAFYESLTPAKIKKVLVPEQCQRITRNGKDVGYRYIVEDTEKRYGHDGIRIGVRSHVEPGKDTKVDSQAWFTCWFNRDEEEWSAQSTRTDAKGKTQTLSELGTSTLLVQQVFDPVHGKVDPKDPGQPPVRTVKKYELRVTHLTAEGVSQPIKRNLPPFYAPQALALLLPRLLAMEPPQTYLFAVWDDNQQQVVARYLDVGSSEEVGFNGSTVRVIPVEDRLGLEGDVTTHYITPDGKELGSRGPGGVISISSDKAELKSIWKTPNLTPPGDSAR